MTYRYPLAKDTIDQEDLNALCQWLQSAPRLTKDKLNVQFEQKWSAWIGRKYSVFCNSGSSANLLMYYALLLSGKLRNKKVIVPSAGWVTTLAPAIQFGYEPIMCEADRDTFGLDLKHFEELLHKHHPSTVILVQVLGVPHKMDAITRLKDKFGFILLEDACACIGSMRHNWKTGTFGDMSSFSFYFGHQMSTIEGGMVSTNDKKFYDLLIMCRSHGWGQDLESSSHEELLAKHQIDHFHTPFVFYEPGFNLRSTDLNAFLGLRQLDKLEHFIARRHANHKRYQSKLGDKFMIQRSDDPKATISSIHFCVLAESTEQRRRILEALDEHSIETRIFSAGNLGLHPFWASRYGKTSFPMADRLHHTGFFLPNHPYLKDEDVDFIADVVLEAACVPKSL